MKNFIPDFVYKDIKGSLIISTIIGLIIYLSFGFHTLSSFSMGYIIGSFNLLLMSCAMNIILNFKPGTAMKVYFSVYAARYMIIGFVFFVLVKYENVNVFALALGIIITIIYFLLNVFIENHKYVEEV